MFVCFPLEQEDNITAEVHAATLQSLFSFKNIFVYREVTL